MENREFSSRNAESNSGDQSEAFFENRRCCFCFPRFSASNRSYSSPAAGPSWWQRIRGGQIQEGSIWSRGIEALKRLREWSEIVAGPRWKTFIRRFNRNRSRGGGGLGKHSEYQYDPLSYSLNFDEGPGHNGNSEQDDEYGYRNFSTRYASIPASAKASMDFGKDGPSFV